MIDLIKDIFMGTGAVVWMLILTAIIMITIQLVMDKIASYRAKMKRREKQERPKPEPEEPNMYLVKPQWDLTNQTFEQKRNN